MSTDYTASKDVIDMLRLAGGITSEKPEVVIGLATAALYKMSIRSLDTTPVTRQMKRATDEEIDKVCGHLGARFFDTSTMCDIVAQTMFIWDGVRNIDQEAIDWVCEHTFVKSADPDNYIKTFTMKEAVTIILQLWEAGRITE